MKKIYFFVVMGFILTACSTSTPMLNNNYNRPKSFTTQKSFDYVWDNVIDLFAESGITVSNIEKSSGFIAANGIEFNNRYTVENKNDKRYDPDAYFVIPNNKFDRVAITASFNVRLRKNDDGTVTVSVNLPNLKATAYKRDIWTGIATAKQIDIASTGVFEQNIFDAISK